jgi:uncharacterized protein (DUF305 family)
MIRWQPIAAALIGLSIAGGVSAQQMKGHDHSAMAATKSPSTAAFEAANQTMMRNMAVPLTGNTDRDFVVSMIPHHQGAIDMAKVELAHGTDPAMKQMAQAIIAAQTDEIRILKDWLAKHP